MEKLTNKGEPHVCGVPAAYVSPKGSVAICPKCNLPVDADLLDKK